jgi:hypothetical protein
MTGTGERSTRHERRRELAATPPARMISLAPWSPAACTAFVTSESTTDSWKAAASDARGWLALFAADDAPYLRLGGR